METITVIIQPDGKTCKEVNSFEKKKLFQDYYYQWQEAESKLRTFEIENIQIIPIVDQSILQIVNSGSNSNSIKVTTIGSQHQAQIINEKTVIIL